MESSCKVCVTGGAGCIGSFLVKKLLQKGYTVHSPLINLKDKSEVGLLRSLPHANARLVLFEADIYKLEKFVHAIQGCDFVFRVATPFQHQPNSQIKSLEEAVIACVRSIITNCIKSGIVKKLIYTGTVIASSPLKDDGSGYEDFIDETCWTPLHLPLSTALHKEYADSKTLAEKELLMSYGKDENGNGGIEVVSLAVGLVGGDALLSYISAGVALLTAQLKDNEAIHQSLKYLEDVCGKIPLVHVDDVCEAHIFCAKTPSINGRFLLANSYASSVDIANYYLQNYPEFNLNEKVDMENKKICSELNLPFWSQCKHHLLPFHGVVHIGYLLSDGFSPVGKSLLQSIVHFYGFKFSRCSYLQSLLQSAVINEFDLAKHGLKLLRRNPSSFTPCLDGRYFLLGADKDFNHSQISKFSQADADAYPKYESQLEKLCKFMDLVLDSSPPEPYNLKHLLMAMNHLDKLFVTNDAATIVNELEVQHPAVKILILASKAQQEEIGDGINLTISFADELLHGVEELIRMGLHPSEIIRMLLVV